MPVTEWPSLEVGTRPELAGIPLRQRVAHGAIVNTAFLVGLSLLTLVRGFILARFLTRADYGLWGVVVVTMGSLLWLKNAGIGDKYIQQDEADQEAAFQRAFTLELAFTMCFVALIAVAMLLVSTGFGQPRVLLPGLVVLLVMPAAALQSPLWIHYRRMRFGTQRTLQAVEPLVGFVVAVGLAVAGAGYWALVAGVVAGAWAAAAAALAASPYRPRLRYEKGTLRSYVSFSWPLVVAGGLSMLIPLAAMFATLAHLGLAAAGALMLAAYVSAFSNQADQQITGALYPAICAVRNRVDVLYESFVKSNQLALMWAVPFGLALSLFSSDLVRFGIGDRWHPVIPLLQIMGLATAVNHVGFNWDAYFRARGETRPIAVAAGAACVAFLASGIPLLFAYGLRGLAIGLGIQTIAHLACRAFYLRRMFAGFGFLRHALRAFLPTIPAVALVLGMRMLESGPRTAGMAVAEMVAFVASTALATWLFEGRLLREAAGYLRGGRPADAVI